MKRFSTFACFALALVLAASAVAQDRNIASQSHVYHSLIASKASGDTIDLMGPGGPNKFNYRGDFEAGSAYISGLPASGQPASGWTSVDATRTFIPGPGGGTWYESGNFARVWSRLGDVDDCASNYSKVVAFLDDGMVVPGTGSTVGLAGNDYGPPEGWIVNNTGGVWFLQLGIDNYVQSPVMTLTGPAMAGLSLAFDVYRHELMIPNDSPGVLYYWSVRSAAAGGNIATAPWRDRGFYYYGGPGWLRSINTVDDLMVPGFNQVQVRLGVAEVGHAFGFGDGTNGTPAPYFDNVRVKAYPTGGPSIVATEIHLANDGFPASGQLNLTPGQLGTNVVRFDMAANLAPRAPDINVPGDYIWVDVTPRAGGTLETPVMHWAFARKNPLFGDALRTGIPAGALTGEVSGIPTYIDGALVPNRYSFDLPDGSSEGGSMLFPGDELHYYFSATDHVGGSFVTSTLPSDLTFYGDPSPYGYLSMAYPGAFTVNCLPSVREVSAGVYAQPATLFWNDFGFRGGEDEWYGALIRLGLIEGTDYDVFTTHGPDAGVGNGLGGRATAPQITGYTDMLYSSGDLGAFTLSNGDYAGDPSKDLDLLNAWLDLGGKDLFMTGDDLASSLYASGPVALSFLEDKMGLSYSHDPDIRDNINNQATPLVVKTAVNPVFPTANQWVAYGGCFSMNDFDNVQPYAGATRLAQFTAPNGVSTPYPYAAATLNISTGNNRVVSMNHDLMYVIDPAKGPSPQPARGVLLSNVLDYFGVSNPGGYSDVPTNHMFTVSNYPNPFNPSLTIKYTLKNPGNVVMKVFNIRGELVNTLINGQVSESEGSVVWDGTNNQGGSVSSGVYFVETRANGEVNVLKATMVK